MGKPETNIWECIKYEHMTEDCDGVIIPIKLIDYPN